MTNHTGPLRVSDIVPGLSLRQYSGTAIECPGCGELWIMRAGAKYCSNTCRSRVERAAAKATLHPDKWSDEELAEIEAEMRETDPLPLEPNKIRSE